MAEMNLGNMCRFGVLPFLLAASASCSDMNSAQDTYDTVYGRLEAGGANGGGMGNPPPVELPPGWACLDPENPLPPFQPPDPPPATINYFVPIADFDTRRPVPGLTVKLCSSSACDPDIPIPEVTQPNPAQPVYLLQIPYGQADSYLQVSAPDYATMDYYFGGPIIGSPNAMFLANAIPMLRSETLDRLLVDVRAPSPAPSGRGVLAIRTLDCAGQRAVGVEVEAGQEMPEGTVPWALSDNNIASPDTVTTDARGVAGFANVPAGAFTVQGIAPVGDGITYGRHTLRVKGGQITLGEVRFGIGQRGQ